jgi:hypothetical protein
MHMNCDSTTRKRDLSPSRNSFELPSYPAATGTAAAGDMTITREKVYATSMERMSKIVMAAGPHWSS